MFGMKLREFITLLGGSAAVWPMLTRAQESLARVGVIGTARDNAAARLAYQAFVEELR